MLLKTKLHLILLSKHVEDHYLRPSVMDILREIGTESNHVTLTRATQNIINLLASKWYSHLLQDPHFGSVQGHKGSITYVKENV